MNNNPKEIVQGLGIDTDLYVIPKENIRHFVYEDYSKDWINLLYKGKYVITEKDFMYSIRHSLYKYLSLKYYFM